MAERRVSELVRQIRGGDVEAADALPEALAELPPSEPSRVLVRRLLEQHTLDGRADSSGISCRAALIAAQLDQGYPWALEVPPDDVVWLRAQIAQRDRSVDLTRGITICLALPSLVWNAGWAALLAGSRSGGWLLPFVIGAGHAAWALTTAWRTHAQVPRPQRIAAARSYRILATMCVVGPIASFIAASTAANDNTLLLSMLFALPAMATAFACLPASERILPEAR